MQMESVFCVVGVGVENQAGRGSAGLDHTGLRCQDSKPGLCPVGNESHGRVWIRKASSRAAFKKVALVTVRRGWREGGR